MLIHKELMARCNASETFHLGELLGLSREAH
jgi:hypothetical protein